MFLEELPLKLSGRPVLLEKEIERLITDKVDLTFYDGSGGLETAPAKEYKHGILTVTSHRLLWIDADKAPEPGRSCFIPLAAVARWEPLTSVAMKWNLTEQKIKLDVFITPDKKAAPCGIDNVGRSQVGLVFKTTMPAQFQEELTKALKERLWDTAPIHTASEPNRDLVPAGVDPEHLQQMTVMGFNRNRAIRALMATHNKSVPDAMDWAIAFKDDKSLDQPIDDLDDTNEDRRKVIKSGLGSIFKMEEEKQKRTSQAIDDAFQDLTSLMCKAEEMVKIADQFYSSINRKEASAAEQDTIDELIGMGITSPVTKESAGSLYHDQLSRQLSDFLEERLKRVGGMMTLPDVYCLYNRARGAELVSPDDLIRAAKLFGKLHIPLKLRTFQSGVMVIQSAAHDEDAICQRISEMLKTEDPLQLSQALTAVDLAAALNVPLTIAEEHLLLAERKGVLCRDDGPFGLRFYLNFFKYL